MKINQFKGYQDTKFTEVLEPLTLEDFIIEETAPIYNDRGQFITTLALQLKEEVAENIAPLLDTYMYGKPDEKITKFVEHFRAEVKFNGCRTQEQKDAKIEKIRQQEVVKMADRKVKRLNRLFERVLNDITRRLERFNDKYEESVREVMSGKRMSTDFIKENLDDADLNHKVDVIEEQIKELRAQQKEVLEEVQEARNQNMLRYLFENGWNDDEEKVVIAPHLREELTEMYKNGEAFERKSRSFPVFD